MARARKFGLVADRRGIRPGGEDGRGRWCPAVRAGSLAVSRSRSPPWDEDKTALSFRLRQGVKWHDGKPFTAKDVVFAYR